LLVGSWSVSTWRHREKKRFIRRTIKQISPLIAMLRVNQKWRAMSGVETVDDFAVNTGVDI
jgi:hypothetical protein